MLRLTLFTLSLVLTALAPAQAKEREAARYLNSVRHEPAFLRAFLTEFPKGADLHSHLSGAVYAERMLKWAAADGLCVDIDRDALLSPEPGKTCAAMNFKDASAVAADSVHTDELIDSLSLRSYVPSPGWSGHDQFFATFAKMDAKPERFGDALASVAARAGRQNEIYLELMDSLNRRELYGYAMQTP
ncbi:MAG: adenosine deaminase, partial [Alphaproteobacteria bacterium]